MNSGPCGLLPPKALVDLYLFCSLSAILFFLPELKFEIWAKMERSDFVLQVCVHFFGRIWEVLQVCSFLVALGIELWAVKVG
jgi:hypothetical protein